MAISQEQKVDYLLKKIGYSASKTGIAEDSSISGSTQKKPFAEEIPSPIVIPASGVWADSAYIPTTPPTSATGTVGLYTTTIPLRMTVDSTVAGNRAFIPYTTYNNTSTPILGNWIDTQFGADYIVKIYKNHPDGRDGAFTKLNAAGSGSSDEWFFDYSSGILNFSGNNLPVGVGATNIYLVGYRYLGAKGAQPPGGIGTFHNLYVSGVSTFVGVGTFLSDLYVGGNLTVSGLSALNGGTISIGDANTDNVVFSADVDSNIIPDDDDTYDLGSTTQEWRNIYIDGTAEVDKLSGFTHQVAPHSATALTIVVTVASKTAAHRYNGSGSGSGYFLDGVESPFLKLTPGRTYKFDQAHNSNSSHQIKFYLEADKTTLYETGVTYNGTAGSAGAYTQIVVGDTTPTILHYQCVNHGYMGNSAQMGSNVVNTNHDAYLRGNLSVTGLSTFTGAIDANGDLDVDGTTNLDIVNISQALRVVGITTFVGSDVEFVGVNAGVTSAYWDNSANEFKFIDDAKLSFGNFGDFQIYHQSSSVEGTYITNSAGNLTFKNTAGGQYTYIHGDKVQLRSTTNNEAFLEAIHNGQVALFHDNVNRFETTGYGATVFGTAKINKSVQISENLNVAGIATFQGTVICPPGGGGGGKFGNIQIGVTGDNEIDTSTGNLILDSAGGAINIDDGVTVAGVSTFNNDVEFVGSQVGVTSAFWDKSANQFKFIDNTKLTFGDSQDLVMYHDGSDSRIVNNTGLTYLQGDVIRFRNQGDTATIFNASTASVDLYGNTDIRLSTTGIGATVFGKTETQSLNVSGIATFSGTVSAASSTGVNGQYLQSTGVGVTWSTFPSARTTQSFTATEGQTVFSFAYNVNYLDVFVNGVKLNSSEYVASNSTTVTLLTGCVVGDIVELFSYNITSTGGGGGGGASILNGLSDVTISGTPVEGELLQHNGSTFVNDNTVTATKTSTSQFALHSLAAATYRTVEWTIQATEGNNYHTTKILTIHNGINASHTEFGTLTIGTATASYTVDINGGNIRLLATPASTNSTVFKAKYTIIKV